MAVAPIGCPGGNSVIYQDRANLSPSEGTAVSLFDPATVSVRTNVNAVGVERVRADASPMRIPFNDRTSQMINCWGGNTNGAPSRFPATWSARLAARSRPRASTRTSGLCGSSQSPGRSSRARSSRSRQTLRGSAGSDKVTLLDATITFTDADVKASADGAKDAASKLGLVQTTIPIVGLVFGLILLGLEVFLTVGARREEVASGVSRSRTDSPLTSVRRAPRRRSQCPGPVRHAGATILPTPGRCRWATRAR